MTSQGLQSTYQKLFPHKRWGFTRLLCTNLHKALGICCRHLSGGIEAPAKRGSPHGCSFLRWTLVRYFHTVLKRFMEKRKLIFVFTRTVLLSLFWNKSTQYTPFHFASLRCVWILFVHIRYGHPRRLFPLPYPFVFDPMSATCSDYLILCHMTIIIILFEEYTLLTLYYADFSYFLPFPPSFGPNVQLSTLPLRLDTDESVTAQWENL
jgi:hypothetical protein